MKTRNIEAEDKPLILRSVLRALLGEISSEMQAISIEWFPESIKVWIYCNEELSSEAKEDFDAAVITQIYADFPYPNFVDFEFVRIDVSERVKLKGEPIFVLKGVRFYL
jgi:hypothetical protein